MTNYVKPMKTIKTEAVYGTKAGINKDYEPMPGCANKSTGLEARMFDTP
jgi:hypothetical protein